ncbi:MAG TPA: tetratricopeptide repeat protein, partial [Nitrospinota bacterium]|nr:tetratricopeptide repeat protein [Nitrospinota bacterium]
MKTAVSRFFWIIVLGSAVSGCVVASPEVKLKAAPLLETGSGTAESYYHYIDGYLKELSGKLDEAGKIYSRAMEKSPNSPDLLTRYASILIRQGKLNRAEKLVRRA